MRPNSVNVRGDGYALDLLIRLHCEVESPVIIDVTANAGVMWKKSTFTPRWRFDLSSQFGPDAQAAFEAVPLAASYADVIVFDPPHLPVAAATETSILCYQERYGITANRPRDDNVGYYFAPFLSEAARVLRPGGIVLAKIADITHNHRYQWQHVQLIVAAQDYGLTPCDLLVSFQGGNLKSSKWLTNKHLRKVHSYWLVIRNATYDEPRANPLWTDRQWNTLPMFA